MWKCYGLSLVVSLKGYWYKISTWEKMLKIMQNFERSFNYKYSFISSKANIPTMSMENSLVLLAIISIATLAFITRLFKHLWPKQNLPPGPKPWPIIGNLNLLGSIPHQSLHHLSQKYGEIMQLHFGKFPVVIASSPRMAEQFLKVHDAVFASRPALAAGKYTAYNYSDMTWAPHGPYWRQARRIFLSEVFNVKRLEFCKTIRVEERRNFLSRLGSLSGEPVVLRDHLYCYTQATICRMVIGDAYTSKSDELREMVDEWFFLNGVFNIGDWIPWLSYFDLQGYVGKMKALHKKFDIFHNFVIEDHLLASRVSENDVVDALLQMADDSSRGVQLTRDCVKALIQDLLVGGTDTSATIVEWAMHEILRQPHIVDKAKEELDRVVGRKRWVDENDFPSHLPYIDAIIMETCRLHPVGTLLGPHYATQNCNVAGYDISKGTTVLINAWSIGRDPGSWEAPEVFFPERFVGKETDMLGSNFALLPFGSGRRRCPGFNLGLRLVRTTLANLVHGFELKLVEGMKAEDVSMEEEFGLTTHPKHPLNIIMEPTLPPYLYS